MKFCPPSSGLFQGVEWLSGQGGGSLGKANLPLPPVALKCQPWSQVCALLNILQLQQALGRGLLPSLQGHTQPLCLRSPQCPSHTVDLNSVSRAGRAASSSSLLRVSRTLLPTPGCLRPLEDESSLQPAHLQDRVGVLWVGCPEEGTGVGGTQLDMQTPTFRVSLTHTQLSA